MGEVEEEVVEEKPKKVKKSSRVLKTASIIMELPTRVIVDEDGNFVFSAIQTDEWQKQVEEKVAEIGIDNLEKYLSPSEMEEKGLAGTRNGMPCLKAKKLKAPDVIS